MFAYVVMSYHSPALVGRVAHRLRALSPEAEIVLRHDERRCSLPDELPAGVHRRPSSVPIGWGHWSMVEAMLEELRWVRQNTKATHVVLISGQDYPVRPLAEWERSVMHLDAVTEAGRVAPYRPHWGPRNEVVDGTMLRYDFTWFRVPRTGRLLESRPGRFLDRAAASLGAWFQPVAAYWFLPHERGVQIGLRRRWQGPPLFKGAPWMMLSARAADVVLASDVPKLYKRTLVPEESVFQTVLMNHEGLDVRREPLTYASWREQVPHPEILTRDHLQAIEDSNAPFARKVEQTPLLDDLDELVERRAAAA